MEASSLTPFDAQYIPADLPAIQPESICTRNPNIEVRSISDDILFVRVEDDVTHTDSHYSTNDMGAAIWELVDGSKTVAHIIDQLVSEYDAEPLVIASDVIEYLGAMQNQGIISV